MRVLHARVYLARSVGGGRQVGCSICRVSAMWKENGGRGDEAMCFDMEGMICTNITYTDTDTNNAVDQKIHSDKSDGDESKCEKRVQISSSS